MSTPTGAQVIAYAKTFTGTAPHRRRENENDLTHWYYGNSTAASFCLIGICYVFDHFGVLKQFLGGKIAYVPNLKARVGAKWHTSKLSISEGDPVTYDFNRSGEPEHVGLFIRWTDKGAGLFEAFEFNTTGHGSSDYCGVKLRRWADVFGYVKPGLTPADPSRYPGKIYRVASPLMHDSHVTWIQHRLVVHKHAVSVDGQYGPKTAAAVRSFQKDAHLTQDGQVGPKTWAALAK
jgi:peptidoglycan hydrolase-like protein with peptidoglycan-binding domain